VSSLFLTTKLYIPPARPELVPRPRLIERLDDGLRLGRKLTLLSAPAGFGKTTLLTEWVARVKQPVAWVSLDKGDNDPIRFWSYLITALQRAQANAAGISVGEASLAMLQSAQPLSPASASPFVLSGVGTRGIETILTTLINEIVASGATSVLVLDDYHEIEAPPIQDAVVFLLDHLPHSPDGVHLVIASRIDPPWPLSHLRVQGQLTELRAADLLFTSDETATFLNTVMRLGLTEEDVAALVARTEGWIAGLQMAALALRPLRSSQGRQPEQVASFISAFSGSHRYVLDYLTDQVLHRQPPDVYSFLLQTAILDRLTGPLCDAVCSTEAGVGETSRREAGWSDGQTMLEQLESVNLFIIPLDDERRWYRYHHLFADLLHSRLRQTWPDRVPVLHRRASEWYQDNGLSAEAVSHALAAGDVDRAVRLVEENALAVMDQGELAALVRWLNALPGEVVRTRPWLCLAHAWALVYVGQLAGVEPLLQTAEEALAATLDEQSKAEGQRLAGHIAAIRAYGANIEGETSRAAELARQAQKCLAEGDLMARGLTASTLGVALRLGGDLEGAARAFAEALAISQAAGDSHVAVTVLCELALLHILQGDLYAAAANCQEALQLAARYSRRGGQPLPVAGFAYALMSRLLREWNDPEAALHHAKKGVALCEQWGQAETLITCYFYLAMALQANGDAAGALDAFQRARQVAGRLSAQYIELIKAHEAGLKLAQGDIAAAVRWVQESGASVDDEISLHHIFRHFLLVRVLIAQDKLDKAWKLLTRLLEVAEAVGAIGRVIPILTSQSLILQAQGKVEQALTTLERALALAEPGGHVRAFAHREAPMGELLRLVVSRDITPDHVRNFARKLLAASLEPPTPTSVPKRSAGASVPDLKPREKASVQNLIKPLTPREHEVLQLVAAGASNPEIAKELVITVNTVKKHITNIFGKLEVTSRTQAVARGRELGMVE
jgi:LuxR family maltose regulon positive regulatory protein